MNIREKNERILAIKFGTKNYETYKALQEKEIVSCCVELCENQEKVICVAHNNRVWRLNSVYDPIRASKLYMMRYDTIRDFSVACVFGMSDGRIIRELLAKCNGTQKILVYEPNPEVFLMAMREFEIDDILKDENTYFVVAGINETEQAKVLEKFVTSHNRELMMHYILPNYDIIYRRQCEEQMEKMLYYSKIESFKKNTEVQFAARIADNMLHNIPYIIRERSLQDLKNTFLNMDLHDIPAIIVSAGPSLDKNIRQLKKAEGKAFIIGVDSALKALVREEINFQVALTVDPRKNPDVFANEKVHQFPYVLAPYAIPLVAECNKRNLFFEGGYGFDLFKDILAGERGIDLGTLNTGGSVATEALSMAIDFGFSKIIFVGQDLAFTGGKGHVSGFEKSAAADKAHVEGRELVEVEAIDGGRVLTDIQMESYRQWFEMRIAENKDHIEFYNATEGGAKIHGSTAISLADAIECFCICEVNLDKIIADIEPAFSKMAQQQLQEKLFKLPQYMMELAEKLQQGIEAYHKLVDLELQGVQTGEEYRQVLQKIQQVNQIEKYEASMAFIKLYSKEAEYDAADDIYVAEELSVKDIADRGIRLLEGYIEGCKVAKTQMEAIMIPRLKELL